MDSSNYVSDISGSQILLLESSVGGSTKVSAGPKSPEIVLIFWGRSGSSENVWEFPTRVRKFLPHATSVFKTAWKICNQLRNDSSLFSRCIKILKPVDPQATNERRIFWLRLLSRDLRVNFDNFRILSVKRSTKKVLHFPLKRCWNAWEGTVKLLYICQPLSVETPIYATQESQYG